MKRALITVSILLGYMVILKPYSIQMETKWSNSPDKLAIECIVSNPTDSTFYVMSSNWELISFIDSLDLVYNLPPRGEAVNEVFFVDANYQGQLKTNWVRDEFVFSAVPITIELKPQSKQIFMIELPHIYQVLAQKIGAYRITIQIHWCTQKDWIALSYLTNQGRNISAVSATEKEKKIRFSIGETKLNAPGDIPVDLMDSYKIHYMFRHTLYASLLTLH
jgi:hypothetical protein